MNVFCYLLLKPCGCLLIVTAATGLSETLRLKPFREAWAKGEVKAVTTQAEWLAMIPPTSCPACEKPARKRKKVAR